MSASTALPQSLLNENFDLFLFVFFISLGRNETPQLFTVLPERRTGPVGAAMMASTHIYDMSTVQCTH